MATRSIKLKLIIPRHAEDEALQLRRALWATHTVVNEAVSHYEHLLLEMRQEAACVGVLADGTPHIVAADVWQQRLKHRLESNGVDKKHLPSR